MKQSYEIQKKRNAIIAALVAGATLLTGSIGIATHANKNKKPVVDETTTEITTNAEDEDYFNVEDPAAVALRAEKIYKIYKESGQEELKIKDIKNIIYMFNDALNVPEKLSAEEKMEFLQKIELNSFKLLSTNVQYYSELLRELKEGNIEKVKSSEEKQLIHAYDLIASGTLKPKAKELKELVEKQKDEILDANTTNFDKNAEAMYKIWSELNGFDYTNKGIEKSKINRGHIVGMFTQIKAQSPIFSGFTKKQTEDMSKSAKLQAILNYMIGAVSAEVGAEKEGAHITTTPTTEKPKKEEQSKAEDVIKPTTTNLDKPVKVDKGGVKLPSIKIEIPTKKPTTTRVETSTFVEKPEASTGSWTEVITGGEVVSESYVDADKEKAENLETTVPKEDVTQVYIDEESTYVIDKGGVPVK